MVLVAVLAFLGSVALYGWLIAREYQGESTHFWASLVDDRFVVRRLVNGDGEPGSWWLFLGAVALLILSFVLLFR